jgi:hypothetical protein
VAGLENEMSTPTETPPAPDGGNPAEPVEPAPPGAEPAGQTFTQADLDRVVSDRLKREREKYADYDDLKTAAGRLKEIEDAQKTEQERLAEQLQAATAEREAAEQRARDLETGMLRQRIAAEKGLPAALADRLAGGTEEEIAADADALLAAYPPPVDRQQRTPMAQLQPGAVPPGSEPPDMNEWMRQKASR